MTITPEAMAVREAVQSGTRAMTDRRAALVDKLASLANGDTPRRILVVDDDVQCARAVERCLPVRDADTVESARTAEEALGMARVASYDLVVADLNLPHMTGADLVVALRARSRRPLVPVLLVSGHEEVVLEEVARRCGANAWLAKPFAVDRISSIASELLRGEPLAR